MGLGVNATHTLACMKLQISARLGSALLAVSESQICIGWKEMYVR